MGEANAAKRLDPSLVNETRKEGGNEQKDERGEGARPQAGQYVVVAAACLCLFTAKSKSGV